MSNKLCIYNVSSSLDDILIYFTTSILITLSCFCSESNIKAYPSGNTTTCEGMKGGSPDESTFCSSRGLNFLTPTSVGSQLHVTPVPGRCTPSSGLCRHLYTYGIHTQKHTEIKIRHKAFSLKALSISKAGDGAGQQLYCNQRLKQFFFFL